MIKSESYYTESGRKEDFCAEKALHDTLAGSAAAVFRNENKFIPCCIFKYQCI